MYQHILMPIDGSACSEHALSIGLELAKAVGAEVTFLYIVTDPLNIYNMQGSQVYEPRYHQDLLRNGEQALEQAAGRARAAGVTAQVQLYETDKGTLYPPSSKPKGRSTWWSWQRTGGEVSTG